MAGFPLSTSEIADHEFTHGFRGYDVDEVRSFLRSVGTEMARLAEELNELTSQPRRPGSGPGDLKVLSREQLVELVGDEAASILAEADVDAHKRLDASVEEGKTILAEAQDAREKVLGELAVRRRDARQELAQLRAGIDQLHISFDDVRALLDTATAVADHAVDDARHAATEAAHSFDRFDRDDDTAAVLSYVPSTVQSPPEPVTEAVEPEIEPLVVAEEDPSVDAVPAVGAMPAVDAVPTVEEATQLRDAEHRTVYRREPAKAKTTDIDDVFARIRMSRESAVSSANEVLGDRADNSSVSESPAVAATGSRDNSNLPKLFEGLDHAVDELAGQAATILKRVLADQLNEVLDARRRAGETGTDFVPAEGVEAYGAALKDILAQAAAWGAGDDDADADVSLVMETVSHDVGLAIRARVNSCPPDARNPDQLIRAIYREWRRERVDHVASDAIKSAYSLGVLSVIGESQVVFWAQRDDGCIYPDCADNALADGVRRGEKFPTGHAIAPLGPGCRCLVVAAVQ